MEIFSFEVNYNSGKVLHAPYCKGKLISRRMMDYSNKYLYSDRIKYFFHFKL